MEGDGEGGGWRAEEEGAWKGEREGREKGRNGGNGRGYGGGSRMSVMGRKWGRGRASLKKVRKNEEK